MRKSALATAIVLSLLITVGLLPGCAPEVSSGLKVVTGTSLIASIVSDVGGDRVLVRNIIPPGSCPGHYDIKPGDIEALAEGDVFLIHHWQQDYENITELFRAADNPNVVTKVIEVKGNWMAATVQAEATEEIAASLAEIDPANAPYYQERAQDRIEAVLAKGVELQDKLSAAGVNEVKVICADEQAGFVGWAGFEIVATYGRPEDFTPGQVAEIITKAKDSGVALVIDNLQSGPEAGKSMAEDIGAVQVTLSNFPGGLAQTETWQKAIEKNVDLLLEALAEYNR